MTLSKQQKTLVKHSFTKIAQSHDTVSGLFYEKLFEIAPDVRSLFKSDINEQGVKLMQMLAIMVASIDDDANLTHDARMLGMRHTHYGTKAVHYKLVGDALLWALKEACPHVMTTPVYDAWVATYQFIAGEAIHAAAAPVDTAE